VQVLEHLIATLGADVEQDDRSPVQSGSGDQNLDQLVRTLLVIGRQLDSSDGRGALAPPASEAPDAPAERARGPRQEAIVALADMADAVGMRPAVIAAQIDYSISNTYNLLQALARKGLVELVPGSHPQRWRLTSQRRNSAAVFAKLAGSVGVGEWTTCADVSIASRGDTSAAWMVCWAVAKLPDFESGHRVLLEGGIAHPFGHDHDRGRPEDVYSALAEEGVRIGPDGRAPAAHRVTWDQLRERSRA
jgi:hypothetical protein